MKDFFQSETLACDSLHGYIAFTSPIGARVQGETAFESDLIDSPWVQRLRQIHQLQTAWFVYPTAEHSRFQHVLGTTRLASRAWATLRESFYRVFNEGGETGGSGPSSAPSPVCVESYLRIAGLLHDVGHGPFGHFFDERFLSRFASPTGEPATHETLGAEIIRTRLAEIISGIRRTPTGVFAPGERLKPEYVAFLIVRPKNDCADDAKPAWLRALRSLFSGLYTIDNLDFVLRDARATGFSETPFDLERLLHYSFFSEAGLTIHRKGVPTLERFLNARADLFRSVYFHRTVRGIDLELADLFDESADLLYPFGNPFASLDDYLRFTDWSLFSDVANWDKSNDPKKRELAPRWRDFASRKIVWRELAEQTIVFRPGEREEASVFASSTRFESAIRELLSDEANALPLRFDVAKCSRRPSGATASNFLFDPATGDVGRLDSDDAFRASPTTFRVCRIFGKSNERRDEIAAAFRRLTETASDDDPTNM